MGFLFHIHKKPPDSANIFNFLLDFGLRKTAKTPTPLCIGYLFLHQLFPRKEILFFLRNIATSSSGRKPKLIRTLKKVSSLLSCVFVFSFLTHRLVLSSLKVSYPSSDQGAPVFYLDKNLWSVLASFLRQFWFFLQAITHFLFFLFTEIHFLVSLLQIYRFVLFSLFPYLFSIFRFLSSYFGLRSQVLHLETFMGFSLSSDITRPPLKSRTLSWNPSFQYLQTLWSPKHRPFLIHESQTQIWRLNHCSSSKTFANKIYNQLYIVTNYS